MTYPWSNLISLELIEENVFTEQEIYGYFYRPIINNKE